MARHESENVDDLNLPDPDVLKKRNFLENGMIVDDEELTQLMNQYNIQRKTPPVICAKEIFNTKTRLYSYYILCAGGQMFDITNTNVRYKSRNIWKLRRTNKTTYGLYTQFLKTKHKTYLYQAERNV